MQAFENLSHEAIHFRRPPDPQPLTTAVRAAGDIPSHSTVGGGFLPVFGEDAADGSVQSQPPG